MLSLQCGAEVLNSGTFTKVYSDKKQKTKLFPVPIMQTLFFKKDHKNKQVSDRFLTNKTSINKIIAHQEIILIWAVRPGIQLYGPLGPLCCLFSRRGSPDSVQLQGIWKSKCWQNTFIFHLLWKISEWYSILLSSLMCRRLCL